jgi:hypothetical protein
MSDPPPVVWRLSWPVWGGSHHGGGPGAPTGSLASGPQVEASYPGQERWLQDYCASGLYILTLLLQGYGFSEDTWPNIKFQKQVTTTWSPGSSVPG